MTQGRSILKLFFILILVLAGVLGGFELYLRKAGFLDAQPANYPCVTGDEQLNHLFQKNCQGEAKAKDLKTERDVFYKTNSLGLRGREPGASAKKMVVLGDSYTEGFGLAETETFPAILEKTLAAKGLGDVEVLNGGTLGFTTVLYGPYFQRFFASLKPSFVLLNLDFTDFTDDAYFLQIAEYGEDGKPKAFPARDSFPKELLPYVYSNKSALLRFIHQEWNQFHGVQLRERNLALMDKLVAGAPNIPEQDIERLGLQGCKKPLEMVTKTLGALKQQVEAAGGKFAIHMYPSGYMVKTYPPSPQNISFVQKWDQLTRKDYSWACASSPKLVDAIQGFATRNGIPFFNSFPFVMAHPQKAQLYYDHDAHWNSRGVSEIVGSLVDAKFLETVQSSWRK